jgi:hypothetical protein
MEKKQLQKVIHLCVFLSIANLPFLTVTSFLGVDTFIDSFHHPESYIYLQNDRINLPGVHTGYIVLEKPTDQDYHITQGDIILYYTHENELQQRVVDRIFSRQGMTMYYTAIDSQNTIEGPIYDHQIIGKIIGTIDETLWNTLCLQLWELSIEKLNVVTLFSHS